MKLQIGKSDATKIFRENRRKTIQVCIYSMQKVSDLMTAVQFHILKSARFIAPEFVGFH